MNTLKSLISLILVAVFLQGCGSAEVISTPIENIDNAPLKVLELTDFEKKNWMHLDLLKDTIPGMSVDKAYQEIIKNKKGETTIVAVIDSGIDITHEDLSDVIWTNPREIADNGIDDDNNGYVDDIHGWNFLGDSYHEQMEYVRLLSSGNTSHPRYAEANVERLREYRKNSNIKLNYNQLRNEFVESDRAIVAYLKKEIYGRVALSEITTEDQVLRSHIGFMNFIFSNGFDTNVEAKEVIESILQEAIYFLEYRLNVSFDGRKTGDDPNDFSQTSYGNGNISPIDPDEDHGTLVAGIIAAKRNNAIGINGVANNVRIMALRAVPSGDEYDKDVALAIRYAADNGAKIINMSFGKYYSPHSQSVRDAILYAANKDVLIVAGSGNEGFDLDKKNNFPNDAIDNGEEIADNYLSVGAIDPKFGSNMVASYSNYGKNNLDVFAPGSEMYSTRPKNSYRSVDGTSFASPAVAGIAALIRSQYPALSASQIKHILMDSGLSIHIKQVVGGDSSNIKGFDQISKSGKIVNAYNALVLASRMSN